MFLSGTPLLPDPQAPIFYLPNIIFLILPLNSAFIISSIVHLFIGGSGIYLLGKQVTKLSHKASLTASCMYILSSRHSAFIEAGHFGLILASAWIPFVLLAMYYIIKKPEIKWSILLSISLSAIFFTHPTTVVLLTTILITFLIYHLLFIQKENKIHSLKYFILGGVLTFGITAIALFPQLEWVPNTNRYLLTTDRQVWPKWAGKTEFVKAAVNPTFFGNQFAQSLDTEKWIAIGISTILLSLKGFTKVKRKQKIIILLFTIPILIISANNVSPFYEIFLDQDWFVFARVTTRSWFVITLVTIFLASYSIDIIKSKHLQNLVIIVVISELLIFSWTKILKPIEKDHQMATEGIYKLLSTDDDHFRVFCTTRCFSQKDVAQYGLETVGGYSTLHQKNYYEHAWQMTGTYWNYYTLALPPIGSYKNDQLDPDFASLGEYNTKYIVSPHELDDPYAKQVTIIDGFHIYENTAYYPRAYYKTTKTNARISLYSPNEIRIDTTNADSNQLVISEVYNHDWKAYTNSSEEIPVQESPNALRSIDLDIDTNFVILKYKPNSYKRGKVITLSTATVVAFLLWKNKKKKIKK